MPGAVRKTYSKEPRFPEHLLCPSLCFRFLMVIHVYSLKQPGNHCQGENLRHTEIKSLIQGHRAGMSRSQAVGWWNRFNSRLDEGTDWTHLPISKA